MKSVEASFKIIIIYNAWLKHLKYSNVFNDWQGMQKDVNSRIMGKQQENQCRGRTQKNWGKIPEPWLQK